MQYLMLAGLLIGALVALGGVRQAVVRRGAGSDWHHGQLDWAMREEFSQSAIRVLMRGVFRVLVAVVVVGGSLAAGASAI
jgi:hypothetical protein